jgi:hypothetical protein
MTRVRMNEGSRAIETITDRHMDHPLCAACEPCEWSDWWTRHGADLSMRWCLRCNTHQRVSEWVLRTMGPLT